MRYDLDWSHAFVQIYHSMQRAANHLSERGSYQGHSPQRGRKALTRLSRRRGRDTDLVYVQPDRSFFVADIN